MGRPRTVDGVRLSVYVDEDTHKILVKMARELGLDTISATIRFCVKQTYTNVLHKHR